MPVQKRRQKRLHGFKFYTFMCHFLNDILAVKGLMHSVKSFLEVCLPNLRYAGVNFSPVLPSVNMANFHYQVASGSRGPRRGLIFVFNIDT